MYNELIEKTLRYPKKIIINTTGVCNLNCVYCASVPVNKPQHMAFNFFVSIMEKLNNIALREITLSGGEPFINPDVERIIRFCVNHCSTGVLTNGTILDRFEALLNNNYVRNRLRITVSLDSYKEDRLLLSRKGSCFTEILNNIKRCLVWGYPIAINCVPTCYTNIDDIDGLLKLCHQLGIQHLSFAPLMPAGNIELWKNLCPSKEIIRYINDLDDRIVESGFYGFRGGGAKELLPCGVASEFITITSSGDIYPCNNWSFPIANITNIKRFEDFWKEDQYLCKLRSLKKKQTEAIKECAGCSFINHCSGGCRASALAYSDSLEGIDPYCLLMKGKLNHGL